MRLPKLGLVMVAILLAAQLASATALDPFNSRPVPISPNTPTNEKSLQQVLDTIYPGLFDAFSDQQSVGMWALEGNGNVMSPQLRFEFAMNAGTNVFGMWFAPDDNPGNMRMLPIFLGGATPGTRTVANITWEGNSIWIDSSAQGVNTGEHTNVGIPQSRFGFYLQGTGGTFYTVDQLNLGGGAQALTFHKQNSDDWIIAFEDLPVGSNSDYNDMVVNIESIVPVPEPASLLLLGSGLFGLGGLIRRKLR